MDDCLFCKIVEGEIPSKKVFEDAQCLVFEDIAPVAPVHFLAIPKVHIDGVDTLKPADAERIGHIFTVLQNIAHQNGLEGGYRIITNVGEDGGQSVRHLHFHLIGGRKLKWEF